MTEKTVLQNKMRSSGQVKTRELTENFQWSCLVTHNANVRRSGSILNLGTRRKSVLSITFRPL